MFGQEAHIVNASSEGTLNAMFALLVQLKASILLVTADAFFLSRREQLVALAARHSIPALCWARDTVKLVSIPGRFSTVPNQPICL
jgi:putative ABC transport system substrate-binding protein